MNKKLVAIAVSSLFAAPAAFAADVTIYGRINNAITSTDSAGSKNTDISSIASRFGVKASSDLGNGLTATGRYEFATTTDREQPNVADLRIGTVGLSGGFGSVNIGNQWSAFYNTVGTDIDPTYTVGYYMYSSITSAPYRSSNTIKYSNSFGPVYLEADLRVNESDEGTDLAEKTNGDGFGVGVRVDATGNLTLAAAYDVEQGSAGSADEKRSGVSGRLDLGNFYAQLGFHQWEQGQDSREHTQLWLGTQLGSTNVRLGYGIGEVALSSATTVSEPTQIVFGVYQDIGGGMKLYYEGTDVDADGAREDITKHILGMRYDF